VEDLATAFGKHEKNHKEVVLSDLNLSNNKFTYKSVEVLLSTFRESPKFKIEHLTLDKNDLDKENFVTIDAKM